MINQNLPALFFIVRSLAYERMLATTGSSFFSHAVAE